jgi:hypothetical protein
MADSLDILGYPQDRDLMLRRRVQWANRNGYEIIRLCPFMVWTPIVSRGGHRRSALGPQPIHQRYGRMPIMDFLRVLDLECLDEEPTHLSGGPIQDPTLVPTEMVTETPPIGSLTD